MAGMPGRPTPGDALIMTNSVVDTTTAHGKLVFGMFALMAEYEAALIKERTVAGLAAARARGRTGGRKPKMTPVLINKARSECTTRSSSPCPKSPLSAVSPLGRTTATIRTDSARNPAPEPSSRS